MKTAFEHEDLIQIQQILQESSQLINEVRVYRQVPCFVKVIVESIQIIDEEYRHTTLHLAYGYKHPKIVEFLLAMNDIDVNKKNKVTVFVVYCTRLELSLSISSME
jgi:hypothetical protein